MRPFEPKTRMVWIRLEKFVSLSCLMADVDR